MKVLLLHLTIFQDLLLNVMYCFLWHENDSKPGWSYIFD